MSPKLYKLSKSLISVESRDSQCLGCSNFVISKKGWKPLGGKLPKNMFFTTINVKSPPVVTICPQSYTNLIFRIILILAYSTIGFSWICMSSGAEYFFHYFLRQVGHISNLYSSNHDRRASQHDIRASVIFCYFRSHPHITI